MRSVSIAVFTVSSLRPDRPSVPSCRPRPLRERDGEGCLTDTALRLVESSGESVKTLRRALSQGLGSKTNEGTGAHLAEVVIAAAILARQLGVDLDQQIEAKLGSPSWHAQL